MVKAAQVIRAMEQLAPLHYAESWDNPGLMVGSEESSVTGIVTVLDVTPEAIDFAIAKGCNMIISHHPLIFKGLKSVRLDTVQGKMLEMLLKHDMTVYSAHTNLDIAEGGLNDMLAARLGLTDVSGFIRTGADAVYKMTTFVPEDAADEVRHAMGQAGAGRIGNYENCSFSVIGEGRFKGNDKSHPVIGESGTLTTVKEVQINVLVDSAHLHDVLEAMRAAHPYEEAAYEITALHEPAHSRYLGRIGSFERSLDLDDFRELVQEALPFANLRFGGAVPDRIRRIAVCSGSGAEFIKNAAKAGVDAYITGDVKYHDAQLAKELGLLVADAGHFGTEEVVAEGLRDYLLDRAQAEGWRIPCIAHENQEDFFF